AARLLRRQARVGGCSHQARARLCQPSGSRGHGLQMSALTARYPGRAPIDAYGNGGFRFADMSHRGSLLCLPSGIYAWPPTGVGDIEEPGPFAPALAEGQSLGLLLLGTGR